MEGVIDQIRAALAPDATQEAKTAGIAACPAILGALGAAPGVAIGASQGPSPVAAIVGALRGVPPDQLLELAIAKLRAVLPADAAPAAVTPLKFHIVPVPHGG